MIELSSTSHESRSASLRHSISRTWNFLTGREKTTYVVLVSLRALSGFLDIVGIALIGLITGLAAAGIDKGKTIKLFGLELPPASEQTLLLLVVVVLVVFVLKALLAVSLGHAIANFLSKVELSKSMLIARYLFDGSMQSIQRFSVAEIQWAAIGSVGFAFSALLSSLATLITEGVLLLLVMTTFFIIDPLATLFVTIYFGLIIVAIQFVIGHRLKKAGNDSQIGHIESMARIHDMVDAYKEIATFRKNEFFINKFEKSRWDIARTYGTINFLAGMPRYVVETALMLGVVAFVGWQFLTGQLASGMVTVGVFLTGGVRIMASLLPLQNAVAGITNQSGQGELAQDLLIEINEQNQISHKSSTMLDLPNTLKVPAENGLAVEIRDLEYSYPGTDASVLKKLNFSAEAGQNIAIIGPSGAGKTTLVDVILGLLEPEKGVVKINGVPPQQILYLHPGAISYVPQRPGIVSGSIAENVALGISQTEIDEDKVWASLEKAYLADFVRELPDGIHTFVGKQSDALSGGQVQRLGLARALYEDPRLIILDEATSALDAGSEAFISNSLDALAGDVTVIVIAHRLSTVQHSDVVYLMEDGHVTASGSFAELRKTVPMVAEYVKLMSFDEVEE